MAALPRLALGKKVIFAAGIFAAFFAILELSLALLGVRPILFDDDPHVGFSSHIPLFVEEVAPDGSVMMATARNKIRFFNEQRFSRTKQPGAYRIFCLGGSTTYGRPYGDKTSFCGWLRELLPAADPTLEWELINAGGISYASYRVANLMEELIRYEPDLFIIYSGQNEFLEERTYGQILDMPRAVMGASAVLGRFRTYAVMKQIIDATFARKQPTDSEPSVLPAEVEALLDDMVGLDAYTRNDELQRQVLDHYRYNLARMTDIARAAGAQVILVNPASNLRDCSPFKSQHGDNVGAADRARWQAMFDQANRAYRAERWEASLNALDETMTIDDRHAHAHYLRGRALWQLNRFEEAKAAFERARDEDVCSLRALTPMRDIVAEVAVEREAPMVDFVDLVEGESEHATPGQNIFLDHVHPTIEGNRLLAVSLILEMIQLGLVSPAPNWYEVAVPEVARRVEGELDVTFHGVALKNLSKVLTWAHKYEDAERLARRATEMIPDDPEAHLQVGVCASAMGRNDEAIGHYRRALVANPDYVSAHFNLANSLREDGRLDEAVDHYRRALAVKPDHIKALYNLGGALRSQGKLNEAVGLYREALRIRPGFVRAHCDLGIALGSLGRLDEAIEAFGLALKAAPDDAETHYNLGFALESRGRVETGIEHYLRALRVRPEYFEVHYNLAFAFKKLGKSEEAVRNFEQALRSKPDHAPTHQNLGLALVESGRPEQALEHFRRAAELQESWPLPLGSMAWLLATHEDPAVRDPNRAIQAAERAAGLTHNQNPAILDILAAAHAAAGSFDTASSIARTALSLAEELNAEPLAEAIRGRLTMYEQKRPYRQPSGAPTAIHDSP